MLSDDELLQGLRERYGTEAVGAIEEQSGRRFVRIKNLPVTYPDAYDQVAGAGAYAADLAREAQSEAPSSPR
jgi:hypothetical protein